MQKTMPCTLWENVYFARRVERYGGSYSGPAAGTRGLFLENVAGRNPLFCSYEDIDWEAELERRQQVEGDVIEGEVIKRCI